MTQSRKLFFITSVGVMLAFFTVRLWGKELVARGAVGDILFEYKYADSYSSSEQVTFSATIQNNSQKPIALMMTSGAYNLRITLFAPSGQAIMPHTFTREFNSSFVGHILPGEKLEGSVYVSIYFPIEEVGEYRCRVTERVYVDDEIAPDPSAPDLLGRPVDLQSPELRFRVEALDPHPKHPRSIDAPPVSPAKELNLMRSEDESEYAALKRAKESGAQKAPHSSEPDAKPLPSPKMPISDVVQFSPMSSLWWIWVVLAFAALGLWGWRRRSRKS